WHGDDVQGLAANRRVPSGDEHNNRSFGDGTEDIRFHPWVGWRTSFGRTGVCSYPFGSARVGLRRLAFYVRYGRPRKRCSQSESVAGDKDVGVIGANLVQ